MSDYITDDDMFIETEETKVDEERLKRMTMKIYSEERSNTKTKKYGEREMKERIKNIIEGELKKCY